MSSANGRTIVSRSATIGCLPTTPLPYPYERTVVSLIAEIHYKPAPGQAGTAKRTRPEGIGHVCRTRSENEPGLSDPGPDEGLGSWQSRRAQAHRKAGSGAQTRRSSGAHRCGRDL